MRHVAFVASIAASLLVGFAAGTRAHAQPLPDNAAHAALVLSDMLDETQDSLSACIMDRDAHIVMPGDTMLRRIAL